MAGVQAPQSTATIEPLVCHQARADVLSAQRMDVSCSSVENYGSGRLYPDLADPSKISCGGGAQHLYPGFQLCPAPNESLGWSLKRTRGMVPPFEGGKMPKETHDDSRQTVRRSLSRLAYTAERLAVSMRRSHPVAACRPHRLCRAERPDAT
jgi:hypothetical protein